MKKVMLLYAVFSTKDILYKEALGFAHNIDLNALGSILHTDLNLHMPTQIESPISNSNGLFFERIQSMVSQTMRISPNPNIEAEVFGDLAHATLDGATLLSLSPFALRLLVFVGRIFAILSDYLPDHSMTPDETIFQLSMLILSSRSLYNDAIALISSSTKSISYKDRKIFLIAFFPVGFSWTQYKILISNALEWVELAPGESLVEESSTLLLTYKGDVYQEIDGSIPRRYGTHSHTKAFDMIGDLSLVKGKIDSKTHFKRKMQIFSPATIGDIEQSRLQYKLRAGTNGSLLLRIKADKLLEIAKEDEELIRSIKNLVSDSIQNRLMISLDERHIINLTSTDVTDNDSYFKEI